MRKPITVYNNAGLRDTIKADNEILARNMTSKEEPEHTAPV
jgi:hypothetical protein